MKKQILLLTTIVLVACTPRAKVVSTADVDTLAVDTPVKDKRPYVAPKYPDVYMTPRELVISSRGGSASACVNTYYDCVTLESIDIRDGKKRYQAGRPLHGPVKIYGYRLEDSFYCKQDWFEVKCEGRYVHMRFKPNNSGHIRSMYIELEGGPISPNFCPSLGVNVTQYAQLPQETENPDTIVLDSTTAGTE